MKIVVEDNKRCNIVMAKQQQQQQQSEAAKPVEPIMCPVPGGMMPEPPQQFMGFQHPQYGAEAIRSPPAGPTAAVGEAAVPASEPPVKGPLPAEHQVIQDVLNEVRNRCLLVVQNQQMKQRLEEIGVKMELLYDRLRMNQLSPASVSGVHRIVSHVQSGDYRGALTVHAETIAKGSFSELSCFMPPLKLLLQYCMQLQVFLQ
ncbi:Protein transport protein Sec31A [Portunus trituberculatus]|uniref:Protein transport protein Sec31A n=1 Tax=Portunus trituberculatus TaxID=210409 RepID=A0A5B7G4V7_PORTR|nr:Protein transport protein Sec31A [Portunus trituberculatus]